MGMRARALLLVSVLCSCSKPPTSTSSEQPVESVAPAAPAAATAASAAKPGAEPHLFVFELEGDRVSFVPPRTVALSRADGGGCTGELPDNGNMYSGADVTNAFNHPDVAKALASHRTHGASIDAKLTANGYPGSITWAKSCRACLEEDEGVARLRTVLETVVTNRRLVCAETKK
jgi:hypothetical protein